MMDWKGDGRREGGVDGWDELYFDHHCCHVETGCLTSPRRFLSTLLFHSGPLRTQYCSQGQEIKIYFPLSVPRPPIWLSLSFGPPCSSSVASRRRLKRYSIGIMRPHIDCVTAAKCECVCLSVCAVWVMTLRAITMQRIRGSMTFKNCILVDCICWDL